MAEMNEEALKKKVDDTWKESVIKEKMDPGESAPESIEVSFGLFISGLMMEGLIALGELEHPITKKKELSVPHAKYIIDIVSMLKEKTAKNLSEEENRSIEAILYELRMRFISKSSPKAKG